MRTKEEKRAYDRQYRKDNPEKVKHWRKDNPEKVKQYAKQWKLRHPEKVEQQKLFNRKHVLHLGKRKGVITGLNKRDYPANNECELCNKEHGRLAYHHWDNSNPSMGIWVCWECHCVCESHEKVDVETIIQKYVAFKRELAEEVNS